MDRSEIGEKLVNLRGNKRREEVAAEVGISFSALVMYEQGKRIPRDEVKMALANYYGVSVQSLFFDTDVHKTCPKEQPA